MADSDLSDQLKDIGRKISQIIEVLDHMTKSIETLAAHAKEIVENTHKIAAS